MGIKDKKKRKKTWYGKERSITFAVPLRKM
jgi:hypothetical protein